MEALHRLHCTDYTRAHTCGKVWQVGTLGVASFEAAALLNSTSSAALCTILRWTAHASWKV